MNQRAYDTKTTLNEELKLIPSVAYAAVAALLLLWFGFLVPLILEGIRSKPGTQPPTTVIGVLLTVAALILSIWLLMVFYVNADAKRRQMNRLLWTLLVIFIPNAIGFIIYFLLRQPIARPCPKCGASLRPEFVFCPACAHELAPKCPGCHRAVQSGWVACAFCGAKLA